MLTGSIWRAAHEPIPSDEFEVGAHYDDLIVGAGLSGLVTALMLQRSGRRVAVLEGLNVGGAATGGSSAKLSLLQGEHLGLIREHNTAAVTAAYVASNLAGMGWLLEYLSAAGVPVDRRTAYSFAARPEGVETLRREHAVTREFGLATRFVEKPEVPFPAFGAVALDDQAQFDPMAVLAALAADFRALGGVLIQRTRVLGMRASSPVRVRTSRGEVSADRAYLLTGSPILDRGLYFAKLTAHRSYLVAFRQASGIPDGMYLSIDEPTRSLRDVEIDGERLLLVGGNGHSVGREDSAQRRIEDLIGWTQRHFPGAEPTAAWGAQDYRSPHRVPFVGWLPRGRGRIFLATGYDKWGMSNAVAAALTLTGDLDGATPPWASVLHRRPTLPKAVAEGAGSGLAVAEWAAKGWWTALRAKPTLLREGAGSVSREGVLPVAVSMIDGKPCAVSGVCSHLGGVVRWNDLERSWDCPLHGSRFAPDGSVLEGPATRPLPPRR
ncbi:FAD-dependent oxidoreductase [Microbacteriaceae bacterium VKM Ac-2855]|nr:FAD-dependent oxidoreductase [Microbacteriaceae bacterium VKM Ac-2855]